jgi:6-phosphogluconolactonase
MEAAVTGGQGPAVTIFPDEESLSRAAADLFLVLSREAIASRGRFSAALSGGSTPRHLYELLGEKSYRDAIDWRRVHVFWVDERCVPRDHRESNFRLAFDTFLSIVPLPTENIHRIKGEEGPDRAAREYEDDVRTFFGTSGMPTFDLIILGVGEDGHTASLFPDSSLLNERVRLAMPVRREKLVPDRVTLTLPVMNNAARVLVLATGEKKAEVVREILEGSGNTRRPAGLVRPVHGVLQWLIDKKAGQKLTR